MREGASPDRAESVGEDAARFWVFLLWVHICPFCGFLVHRWNFAVPLKVSFYAGLEKSTEDGLTDKSLVHWMWTQSTSSIAISEILSRLITEHHSFITGRRANRSCSPVQLTFLIGGTGGQPSIRRRRPHDIFRRLFILTVWQNRGTILRDVANCAALDSPTTLGNLVELLTPIVSGFRVWGVADKGRLYTNNCFPFVKTVLLPVSTSAVLC